MLAEEALNFLSEILQEPPLNDIQALIFQATWEGKTYTDIAAICAYEPSYIRDVGSKLWQRISKIIGQKVTKNNIRFVLQQYAFSQKAGELSQIKAHVLESRVFSPDFTSYSPSISPPTLEFPLAPVPLGSQFYVSHPQLERAIYQQLNIPGSFIRIQGAPKSGKSSLLIRAIDYAQKQNYRTAYLDLGQAEENLFHDLSSFLRWFCSNVARELKLSSKMERYWQKELGSKVSCSLYFQNYLFTQIEQPLVISLNNLARIFKYPDIVEDFILLLRSWYEQTRQNQLWQKLRMIIVYTTELPQTINSQQFFFNLGVKFQIPYFTWEQVQQLSLKHQLTWTQTISGKKQLAALFKLVGGHPYLIRKALYLLACQTITIEKLLKDPTTQARIYQEYLNGFFPIFQQHPYLQKAFEQVIATPAGVLLESITAYQLENLGLIKLQGNIAQVSCPLYRIYFAQHLAKNKDKN